MTNYRESRKVIQIANTQNGCAVGIIQDAGTTGYQVIQISSDNQYVTWDRTDTEEAARASANRLWLRDMGREVMITC